MSLITEALPNNNLRGVIIANYATTAALAAGTYANGTAGVGATFTVTAVGALAAIDGQTPALNDIVLVKDQASGLQNGVYKVTTLGDGSTSAVLTRIPAADTAAKIAGCNVDVLLGTANANTVWAINLAAASITVGTTALTFATPHTSATVPADIGYPDTVGTAPHLARRDHVHAPWNQNRFIHRECEFEVTSVGATSVADPGLVWNANSSGAAVALAVGTSNATAGIIGTVTLSAGTAATGAETLIAWGTNSGLIFPFAATDIWEYEYVGRTPTVSDGTDTYKVRWGVGDFGAGAPTTGIWFEWDANSDTHILCKSATGTVVTTDVTSTVVAGTGMHRMRIFHTSGATFSYEIDGVVVGTGTTPAAAMGPTFGVVSTAGSSAVKRKCEIDYFRMNHYFAANRYT